MDANGDALEAAEGWDVCHTLTTYATNTVIGMLAEGYGIDKANLKAWDKTNRIAAYLHGSFLKDSGAPNTNTELDKIIAIESVKKFLEGLYPGVDLTNAAFEKSFDTKELVFGTVKLAIGTTDATKAGVASLPTMLHTYLKMASKPGTASKLITTKAMPYLQFTTDSSSTGAVVTGDIKIEFKIADAEGTWATVKGLAVRQT